MGRRAAVIALIVAVIAGAWYYFTVYRPPRRGTDRQQIMRVIANVERAVEQNRVSEVMDHISEEYEDPQGLDRRAIHRMALAGARNRRNIDLSVQVPEIEVTDDTARFVADVQMRADGGDYEEFTVSGHLQRESGRWMVVSAEGWQRARSAYY
ncbi:MAG: hypothetical protein ACLFU7_06145 [Armatimonadota bacterium]